MTTSATMTTTTTAKTTAKTTTAKTTTAKTTTAIWEDSLIFATDHCIPSYAS